MFQEFRNLNFLQPGGDGELPTGFVEWQRGLTYTVRPEILAPLCRGREYRINATVRRKIAKGVAFTYDDVYARASAIVNARIAELGVADQDDPPHTWILAQAWFCHELASENLISASITKSLVCPGEGTARHRGEDVATAVLLAVPSGGVPATFAAKHRNDTSEAPHVDEIYVDFDMSHPSGAGRDITLSYGEYVTASRDIDFEPFVLRAEGRARFHCQSLSYVPTVDTQPFTIARREWTCLSTDKQKDPHIVVVHLWMRL